MTVNTAKFEESTPVLVDEEVEEPHAGWTLVYVSVNRMGSLVALHVEASFADGAAAPVLTLSQEFCPGAQIVSPDGKFTLSEAGVLSFPGSTAGGGDAVAQLVYAAGTPDP